MAEILYDEQLVCIDCADVIANGWGNFNENYPDGYSETNARREDIENGLSKVEGHWALSGTEETFSSHFCDLCGSRFAGARFGAVVLS